jgi:ADP-ribose pyrophosphatase YjhB (NUDIX family)
MPSADLARHPRPHVAVDLVILTITDPAERSPELGVVVVRGSDNTPALPGRFVRERHTIKQTVDELMAQKVGFQPRRDLRLEMLGVYDDPDRDERAWAISIAYATAVSPAEADLMRAAGGELLPLHGAADRRRRVTPERLAFDHDDMVTTALRRARRRYERTPDPLGLLRPPYTLRELRKVHEAVLDEPLRRDTFNRRMQEHLVVATDRNNEPLYRSETVGRPAQMFRPRLRKDRDPEAGPFPLPRAT